MKSKRGVALLLLAIMLLLLMAGCGGADKINAPFTDEDGAGMNYADVMEQLAAAGFTQITTETMNTNSKSRDGEVVSVVIGDMESYNTANKFKPDAAVIVKYYVLEQFEVSMEITPGGDPECPTFSIETNLPDNTELTVTLTDGGSYTKSQTAKVKNGTAITDRFFGDYHDLAGDYSLVCTMRVGEQGFTVKGKIGSQGECMAGPLVKIDETTGEQYIYLEQPYTAPMPEEPEAIPAEEMIALIEQTMAQFFGDDCAVELVGTVYVVNLWCDGIAETAVLAKAGADEAAEVWADLRDTTTELSISLCNLLAANGHGSESAEVNILNDIERERILLTAYLGFVTYDYVAE